MYLTIKITRKSGHKINFVNTFTRDLLNWKKRKSEKVVPGEVLQTALY